MVTTRSADKRVDTTRAEDLVLRSRTVHSPSSSTPTPSQLRKRRVRERDPQDSPRPKRARIGLDGANDAEDANPSGVDVASAKVLDTSDAVDSDTSVLNTVPEEGQDGRTHSAAEANTTPVAKPSTRISADTPATRTEIFMTPATSKHKRYGSEELNDDTIIINQSADSSAHNDYHTADEDAEASDDAPEIASTRTPSAKPQFKSRRTHGTKKQASTSTARKESLAEKKLVEPLSVVQGAELTGQPLTQSEAPSLVSAESEDTITYPVLEAHSKDLDATTPTSHIRTNTLDPQAIPLFAEEQSVGERDTNVDDQLSGADDVIGPSSISHIPSHTQSPTASFPTNSVPPNSFQERSVVLSADVVNGSLLPKPNKTRLERNTFPPPAKSNLTNRAGKTLESFRRNRLNQRLRLENTWSKKRSAFAVT